MKIKNYINKIVMVALLSLSAGSMYAQSETKECDKFTVESFNISNSTIILEGGNLIITDQTPVILYITITTPNGKVIVKSVGKALHRLIGTDKKGNKWVAEETGKFNEKTGLYEATITVKASKENPFIISQVGCSITNTCDETTTITETIAATGKKPNFEILLNGYKNPVKYGQCWVFSKLETDNDDKLIKLEDLKIKQTLTYNSEKKTTTYGIEIVIANSKENENSPDINALITWGLLKPIRATIWVSVSDLDNQQQSNKLKAYYLNLETQYDANLNKHVLKGLLAPVGTLSGVRLTASVLHFRTSNGSSSDIESEYVSGFEKSSSNNFEWTEIWHPLQNTKETNPCKTKYKLKDIEYSETTLSGIYGLQFSFGFEDNSDLPAQVRMIVVLTDCNGTNKNIEITLKYNSKTSLYSGGQSISQSKECPLALTYGEIGAYNSCKDKTVWSFDPSKAKGNGSGTRTASTQTSTKPELL